MNTHTRLTIAGALHQCTEFPHIQIARQYSSLLAIGRLRHEQYVKNQRKKYFSAVLDKDCLLELADFMGGVNIFSIDKNRVSAAMRVALIKDLIDPQGIIIHEFFKSMNIDPTLTLAFARMVRADYHNGRHAGDLIRFVRLQAVRAGFRYGIMQTTERLIPYFRRFDFTPTEHFLDDPIAGRLFTLFIDTKMRPFQ